MTFVCLCELYALDIAKMLHIYIIRDSFQSYPYNYTEAEHWNAEKIFGIELTNCRLYFRRFFWTKFEIKYNKYDFKLTPNKTILHIFSEMLNLH